MAGNTGLRSTKTNGSINPLIKEQKTRKTYTLIGFANTSPTSVGTSDAYESLPDNQTLPQDDSESLSESYEYPSEYYETTSDSIESTSDFSEAYPDYITRLSESSERLSDVFERI